MSRRPTSFTTKEVTEQIFQDKDSDDSDIDIGDSETDDDDVVDGKNPIKIDHGRLITETNNSGSPVAVICRPYRYYLVQRHSNDYTIARRSLHSMACSNGFSKKI